MLVNWAQTFDPILYYRICVSFMLYEFIYFLFSQISPTEPPTAASITQNMSSNLQQLALYPLTLWGSQSHTGSPYKEKPSAHFQWNMISPSPKLSHCNGVGQKSNRQCKSTTNSAQETSKAFTSDQNNQHLKYNWKLKKTENPDKYANMHFVKSCKKEWPDRQGWPD